MMCQNYSKYYIETDIEIEVRGISKIFDINNISLYKIKQWYKGLSKPTIRLKLSARFENEDYDKYKIKRRKDIKIPASWTVTSGSCSGGSDFLHITNIFTGPNKEKEKVIQKINNYYKHFDYELEEI